MSLYLLDQKLGSKSQPGSSSHKFVIKGRQTGSMHRGHTWVFRAESYETMQAWYDDIKTLTEKTGEERNAFVRRHASVRSASAGSARSASSDGGLEEDEADAVPYSASQSVISQAHRDPSPQRSSRPSPGGRFPSDLNVNRNLVSPSSGSSEVGNDLTTAAGGPHQDAYPTYYAQSSAHEPTGPIQAAQYAQPYEQQEYPAASYVNAYPPSQQAHSQPSYDTTHVPATQPYQGQPSYIQSGHNDISPVERHDSNYGNWMAPAAGGAAAGALAGEAYRRKQMEQRERAQQQGINEEVTPQEENRYFPVQQSTAASAVGAAPAIPERDPDHIAPDPSNAPIVTTIPAPIVAASTINQTQEHQDRSIITPATITEPALGTASVAPVHGETINGGPVPVELVQVAESIVHPGVARQNTDFSVSDLHVPGEYPKGRGGAGS